MKCMIDLVARELFSSNASWELFPSNASWNEHVSMWRQATRYIAPMRLTIALFLIVSNLVMIVGIWKTTRRSDNSRMSIPKKMFFSSAVCGLFTGLVVPNYEASELIENGCVYQSVSDGLLNFSNFLDFGKLISIGIVRFVILKYPLNRIVTGQTLYAIWMIEAVFAAAITSYGFVLFSAAKTDIVSLHRIYINVYGIVSGCCMVLTVTLSLLLWINFRKELTVLQGNTRKHRAARANKAVKRLLAIALVYMVCNLPICVLSLTLVATATEEYLRDPLSFSRIYLLANWFYSLVIFYSGLNSCIYVFMDKRILAYFKSLCLRDVSTEDYRLRASSCRSTSSVTATCASISKIWWRWNLKRSFIKSAWKEERSRERFRVPIEANWNDSSSVKWFFCKMFLLFLSGQVVGLRMGVHKLFLLVNLGWSFI